jgi:hypothetical protein
MPVFHFHLLGWLLLSLGAERPQWTMKKPISLKLVRLINPASISAPQALDAGTSQHQTEVKQHGVEADHSGHRIFIPEGLWLCRSGQSGK